MPGRMDSHFGSDASGPKKKPQPIPLKIELGKIAGALFPNAEVPQGFRQEKVEATKEQIARGGFETEERINGTVDAILRKEFNPN